MAKILVADDEAAIVSLITEVLVDHRHTVFMALNGRQAFEICLREKPQLVISDIMMPGLDGYQLSHQIKTHSQLGATKVVLMTAGFFNKATAGNYYDEFLKKPFDIEEIEQLLARIFPGHDIVPPMDNNHSDSP